MLQTLKIKLNLLVLLLKSARKKKHRFIYKKFREELLGKTGKFKLFVQSKTFYYYILCFVCYIISHITILQNYSDLQES